MITDVANVIASSMINLLDEQVGRAEPECIWLSTSKAPGVGCCDSILIRHQSLVDASTNLDCVSGPFDLSFRVGITRCKPSVQASKDSLTVGQEASNAGGVQDERWAIARHGKAYLSHVGARVQLTRITPYDDSSCSGTVFDIAMRVPGSGILGAVGAGRHLLDLSTPPVEGDLLRWDSAIGAFVPSAVSAGGENVEFTFTDENPWTANHSFDYKPHVTCIIDGAVAFGTVSYGAGSVTVTHGGLRTGTMLLG